MGSIWAFCHRHFWTTKKIETQLLGDTAALPRGGSKDRPWVAVSAKLLASGSYTGPSSPWEMTPWKAQCSGKNKKCTYRLLFQKVLFSLPPKKKWLYKGFVVEGESKTTKNMILLYGFIFLFKHAKLPTWFWWHVGRSSFFWSPKVKNAYRFEQRKSMRLGPSFSQTVNLGRLDMTLRSQCFIMCLFVESVLNKKTHVSAIYSRHPEGSCILFLK